MKSYINKNWITALAITTVYLLTGCDDGSDNHTQTDASYDSSIDSDAAPEDSSTDSDVASEVDNDSDGFASTEDCDDDDDTVFPGAEEICDAKDNDCDDEVDNGSGMTVVEATSGLTGISTALATITEDSTGTICLETGTYTGDAAVAISGNKTVNFIAQSEDVTLSGSDSHRVFDITQEEGETLTVSFDGIEIANGYTAGDETGDAPNYGAGIRSIGASLSFDDCTLNANTSTNGFGGGMYINVSGSSTLTITDSNFIDNSAGSGGGLSINAADTAVIAIYKISFSGNNAGSGAGLHFEGYDTSSILISTNNFIGNIAQYDGGGLYSDLNGSSSFTVTYNTFTDNQAGNNEGGGAAFILLESEVNFSFVEANNTFSGNTANGSTDNIEILE